MGNNAVLIFQRSQLGDHVHPFVISEVEAFCAKMDKVYLICFNLNKAINELEKFKNLRVVFIDINKKKKINGFFLSIFSSGWWEDFCSACKNHLFSLDYIKRNLKVTIFGYYLSKEIFKILKEEYNDDDYWVIEGYWFSGPAYAAALVKRKYPKIFCFTRAHSSEVDNVRNPCCICQRKKFIYDNIDSVFFVSQWGLTNFKEKIITKIGIKDIDKCQVMYIGTNKLPKFPINIRSKESLEIVTCSRAVKLKRVNILIEALKNIDRAVKIEWTHIGDGPELNDLKKQASTLPKNILTNFKGFLSNYEVNQYYANSTIDLFINLSEFEGLPISIMEAMSYGIPVIATSAGGTSELVNEQNGILLPVKIDYADVVKALQKFLSTNDDERKKWGENSYKKWADKYNKNENYTSLFDFILNSNGK